MLYVVIVLVNVVDVYGCDGVDYVVEVAANGGYDVGIGVDLGVEDYAHAADADGADVADVVTPRQGRTPRHVVETAAMRA